MPNTAWHTLSSDAVFASLGSTRGGLTQDESRQRLSVSGANQLEFRAPKSVFRRLLRQFQNVLLYVLLGAAVITALLTHWVDTGVILAVVVINAVIGFIQEGRAERALDAIRTMLSPRATVLRDGVATDIDAREVVPGDVVLLRSGDRIAADLRLFTAKDLEVDESILTGESQGVGKSVATLDVDVPLADRVNMAYAGTLANRGQAQGVVVATGVATEIGRVSELLESVQVLTTPLLNKIGAFGRRLSGAILLLAAAIALFGVIGRGLPATEMMLVAVSIAVAAIPEGLPPVITITLAIGVQLLARRNAIVRRLPAVETLGEVTVICTDKTGTLTRNEMTVRTVDLAERRLRVTGAGYDPVGSFTLDGRTLQADDTDLRELARAGLNCNDASLRKLNGQWQIRGDPTEAALLTLAGKAGFDIEKDGGRLPRVDAVPFESERRFMATVHTLPGGGCVLYVKGAPETVLDLCHHALKDGTQVPLDGERWRQAVEEVAARGERVLGLAMKQLDQCPDELTSETIDDDLVFLGFVGVADPPRSETPSALAACRAAGIHVKMITGDHASTAAAIAREIGLAETATALTGQELDALPAKALARAAGDVDVFARTSPEHKLWLVEALQAQGQVVAMTGDGVNDAPALKRADIGIAMGGKGTEAAREAAEMVLADDDFSTIVSAVEQGRAIYDNITKSILFLLPTSFAEALVIAVAVLLGYDLPMTPVQILWVNMITAVTLGIALAFERAEPDIMLRDPRVSHRPILSPLALWRTGYVGLLMLGGVALLFSQSIADGASLDYARTMAVNLLVVFEAVYLLASRYTNASVLNLDGLVGNPVVLISIASVMSFQMLFTYSWPLNTWFQTAPLSGDAWIQIAVLGGVFFLIVEIEKWVRRWVLRAAKRAPEEPVR